MAADVLTVYISVIYSLLFLVCAFIVYFYAESGFPKLTYLTLTIGYYAAFGILLLVPIDIACCVVDRRSTNFGTFPPYDHHKAILSAGYNVFFTIILIFGSVVLVLEEYYNTDVLINIYGYFNMIGRLSSAFYRFCVDTVMGLVAGLIVLGILIGKKIVPSSSGVLMLAAVIVTNTVYELFLVVLLAYGLVEFPRKLWNMADLDYYLLLTQMAATADYRAIGDYKVDIQQDISKINYFKVLVNTGSGDETLIQALEVLQTDCPTEFRCAMKASPDEVKKYLTKSGQVTLSGLARLRSDLKISKNKYKMAKAKVQTTQALAYFLEDLIASRAQGGNVIHWSLTNTDSSPFEYKWHIVYKPLLLKFLAINAGVWSFFSFLGAVCSMHNVNPKASVYFLAVHDPLTSLAGIAIFILFTLGYAVAVTLWALFQMNFAGMSVLVPFSTAPEGLSFNVRMVARLAAPMAFFYLGWIAESGLVSGSWTSNQAPDITILENVTKYVSNISSAIVNQSLVNITSVYNYTVLESVNISGAIFMPSSFSNFYQLQKVKIIEQTFGTLFPSILIVLVPAFATNIINRLLVLIKLGSWQFGTPIPTEEQLREGKRQLAKYRKLAERTGQRGALRSHIMDINDNRKTPGSVFSAIFSMFSRKDMQSVSQNDIEAPPILPEPLALSGMIEKKGTAHLGLGASWKSAYAEVRVPGILHFFKDAASAAKAGGSAVDAFYKPLDLRLVVNFITPVKKGENVQLDLELTDDIVKIRFKTVEDQERWKGLLIEWKDYANDYAELHHGGVDDDSLQLGVQMTSSSATENVPLGRSSTSKSGLKGKAATAQALADLDSIVVEDPLDDDTFQNQHQASSSFSLFKKGGIFASKPVEKLAPQPVADPKPSPMSGWLEKKNHGSGLGGNFVRRFCRIDEATCSFIYCKSDKPKEKVLDSLDLREVAEITAYEKGGKTDNTRFNIEMGERIYKFKADSEEEGEKWVTALNAWREYFLFKQ